MAATRVTDALSASLGSCVHWDLLRLLCRDLTSTIGDNFNHRPNVSGLFEAVPVDWGLKYEGIDLLFPKK
jgi:hypothetical protein